MLAGQIPVNSAMSGMMMQPQGKQVSFGSLVYLSLGLVCRLRLAWA